MADNPQTQSAQPRPLSPFISIYRWPVTMAASITHRVTGVGLALGMILVAWMLIAVATGPNAYETFVSLGGSIIGRLILFGFAWAVVFHFLNGIRHLAWDVGFGFKVPTALAVSSIIYVLSVLGAIALFAWGYHQAGLL
ncbi:MAG TPA: succinate dehydrogenase, cytochrome b556 subunit [Rhizomicrobium sp.]|jgi:succinate dehydrogenase / fumarate reductase cytochrome b subunit|nr:succinate dehydrogenase, cytochrome b556 subunit [Rhizomicrobium sp.]